MKRSKLEAYYHDRFDDAETETETETVAAPAQPPRLTRRRRVARQGFGVFGFLKLTLMLGPMAILLGATLLVDCQGMARNAWVPGLLRDTACARRDLAGRVFTLDGNLRTIAGSMR